MATSTEQFEQGEIAEVYVTDLEKWYRCEVLRVLDGRFSVLVLPFTDEDGDESLGWKMVPWARNLRKESK